MSFSRDKVPIINDTDFIDLRRNSIFSNFQDTWLKHVPYTTDFEISFHPFNIDDCRLKK